MAGTRYLSGSLPWATTTAGSERTERRGAGARGGGRTPRPGRRRPSVEGEVGANLVVAGEQAEDAVGPDTRSVELVGQRPRLALAAPGRRGGDDVEDERRLGRLAASLRSSAAP